MKLKERSMGTQLVQALTEEQVEILLDILLKGIDLSKYEDRLRKADPDMAGTMAKILKSRDDVRRTAPQNPIASTGKRLEEWKDLWEQWHREVTEVGDEEGKYVYAEERWDPPTFDASALADDLDGIAEEMLPLIDDVFESVKEPELFSAALAEIDENILSYPDWMGVQGYDKCTVGEKTTRCILQWLWRASLAEKAPVRAFLAKVWEIEDECEMVEPDAHEMVRFFTELPEDTCRAAFDLLKQQSARKRLKDIDSPWHIINHAYEERFDSSRYLKTCKVHLVDNWRYGRPLIDDAVARKAYNEADSFCQNTFAVLLHDRKTPSWRPEQSLLLPQLRYIGKEETRESSELLESWVQVAQKLSNPTRAAASQFQGTVLRAPDDWPVVSGEYVKLCTAGNQKALDSLFREWQNEMAWQSLPNEADDACVNDSWIHWLIEAGVDKGGNGRQFAQKLERWIEQLKSDSGFFRKQWHLLAMLTKDLPGREKLQRKYPELFATVLAGEDDSPRLAASRRSALEDREAGRFLPLVMSVWEKRLAGLIPNPEESSGDYTRHAKWMNALYELNRSEYQNVLGRWHNAYKQRRNLWRDLKARNLPV